MPGFFLQVPEIPNDGTLIPLPVDRDIKTIIEQGVVDPVFDIDILPLTYTNSRWSAFAYEADEKDLNHVLPEPLVLEDDVVEFWYVDHNSTMLGPYLEFGVTVSSSYTAPDGTKYYGGYYPYMYLSQDSAVFAGREPFGFPKKFAYITILEHGGRKFDGYQDPNLERTRGATASFGNDFFSFMMERRGWIIHTATGRYSDRPLERKPYFYGRTEYGRFNMRLETNPDLTWSEYNLTYLASDWPPGSGKHRFQLKPESVRTAVAEDIRTWFLQATPFDNLGAMLPPKRLLGLITFSFDLIIPAASILWRKRVERTADEITQYCCAAEMYHFSMRHRFPKPVGV